MGFTTSDIPQADKLEKVIKTVEVVYEGANTESEIAEELGMKVDEGKCLFTIPNEYLYSGWTLPTLDLFYLFQVEDDFIPVPADDVKDCYFVPLNQIDIEKFGFISVRKALGRFLLNR